MKLTGGTEINIDPTATVSPNTINDQGGQVITFTGTGFPDSTSLDTRSITISVSGSDCINIQLVSATSMKCTTGNSMPTGSQTIMININRRVVVLASSITIAALGSTRATVSP